jgi:hypothetical protein
MNKTALRDSLIALGKAQPALRPAIRPVLAALVPPKQANMNVPRFRPNFKSAYMSEVLYQMHLILNERFWIEGFKETGMEAVFSGENKEKDLHTVTIVARANSNMSLEVSCSYEQGGHFNKFKTPQADAKQAPDAFASMIIKDMVSRDML